MHSVNFVLSPYYLSWSRVGEQRGLGWLAQGLGGCGSWQVPGGPGTLERGHRLKRALRRGSAWQQYQRQPIQPVTLRIGRALPDSVGSERPKPLLRAMITLEAGRLQPHLNGQGWYSNPRSRLEGPGSNRPTSSQRHLLLASSEVVRTASSPETSEPGGGAASPSGRLLPAGRGCRGRHLPVAD